MLAIERPLRDAACAFFTFCFAARTCFVVAMITPRVGVSCRGDTPACDQSNGHQEGYQPSLMAAIKSSNAWCRARSHTSSGEPLNRCSAAATRSPTAVAMYTMPGGVPSCDSPPATPVVDTATSAPNSRLAPVAISRAAARLSTDSAVTPKRSRLISSWYATRPPRRKSAAFSTHASTAATRPAVQDSAVAIVRPSSSSATRRATSSSSASPLLGILLIPLSLEVGDQRRMVRRSLAASFDVVDPGRRQPLGESNIGCQQVDPHAQVRLVCEAVCPPREATLTGSPTQGVEVDESSRQDIGERRPFGIRDVSETGEGIGVEDVAVRRRNVDV